MYKVSILVPIYGVEQYIERCSRSLFEQTYQNLEFVFVNDCTPDRSVSILKEVIADYPDRKTAIRIVDHEKNQGLAASRNTGLDNSTGDFVYCVDSDDWLETNAIESLVHSQLENDADIVTGVYLVHYDEGKTLLRDPKTFMDKEQMVLQMMQRTWDHFVAGRVVRRSLFVNNALHWRNGLDVAEDRYMMTMLAYHSKGFNTVNDVVYHYERRNCNAITKASDGVRILRNHNQELENVLLLEQFFRDKEIVYQKECSRCVMEQLESNLQAAVSFCSKDDFLRIANVIDSRDAADRKSIGWEKSGLKGWMMHSLGFYLYSQKKNRAIRFIRKRVKAFFSCCFLKNEK